MTGAQSAILIGFNRPLRHLGPRPGRQYTWSWPWVYLSAEDVRRLEAETGGYYVAYCGSVAVVPRRHPGQRPAKWAAWGLCTACLDISGLDAF